LKDGLERFKHLRVIHLTGADDSSCERLVDRSMQLSCLIDDQQIFLSSNRDSLTLEMTVLKDELR
jgi:uncharacterized protein YaeQ